MKKYGFRSIFFVHESRENFLFFETNSDILNCKFVTI